MKATAIGRLGGLLPGPESKKGANNNPPNASPGRTRIPSKVYGPLAKSYFNNSYKNKKYQSANGIYSASVGSDKLSNVVGAAIVTHKNPTRNTEPTIHSFRRKFGQKASVLPGYSEYSFGTVDVLSAFIRESPTKRIPLPLCTAFPPYSVPALPCLRLKIK